MVAAYYNELDKHAAEWLRNLIAEGLIADGDVDERPIQEVKPDDLSGYTQCHFFAGIGGWSYALRLAGWSDERPVWTGSCPCQSFSTAGKREGASDERHLWPDWFRLIEKCQPSTVFGEQVAGAIGFGWLDAVATDFESQDYAFASAVLSGFTVGAHHKRQRLWFVADSDSGRREERHDQRESVSGLVFGGAERLTASGIDLADTQYTRSQRRLRGRSNEERQSVNRHVRRCSAVDWEAVEWVECHDKKTRPIPLEPNVQPLVNGLPSVVDREGNSHKYSFSNALKGIGNAIIPEVAAEFINVYMDIALDGTT